ncbi:unnamed protein product [marine sediment metagenome]|uniref:Uncharacterized protein n=1 Tax=marine sediment metagenome TaxID=412755 RepID=X1HBL4_9ZZZZ
MDDKAIERLQDDKIIEKLEGIINNIKIFIENDMTKNHRLLMSTFEVWMKDRINDRSLTLNLEQLRKSSDEILITLRRLMAEASEILKKRSAMSESKML